MSVVNKYEKGCSNEEELKMMTQNITRAGISREEVRKLYDIWAPNFHKDVSSVTNKAPMYVTKETEVLFKDKTNVRVLDAACGTGLVGQLLIKAGFSHIDALDGSAAMIEEAKKLNIYENLYVDYMGPNRLAISDDTYDAVVTTGSFVPGHVKDDCYEEIIRILKPGGYFIIGMGENYFFTDPEWTKNIEPHMEDLEKKNQWKKIVKKKEKDYLYEGVQDCILYVLQKSI